MASCNITIHESQLVFATVIICKGCCCHREDKGNFNANLSKIEEEWTRRKLFKVANLIISGCTGHCNLANNIAIVTPSKIRWFGKLNDSIFFDALLDWVEEMSKQNTLIDIPEVLLAQEYTKYK